MQRTGRGTPAVGKILGVAAALFLSAGTVLPGAASTASSPTPGETASTSAVASPSEAASPGPVYPTVTPPDEDEPVNLEEGDRVVPSVGVRTEHLDVAVMDSLDGEIDTDALVAAVESMEELSTKRILLAVDRQPAGSPHARSLAGSMILMIHPEILRDDWLDRPEGSTLVGDDWMMLSVILPEEPGTAPADVYFAPGTNVDIEGSEAEFTAQIAAAGAPELDAGDYTAGLQAMLATAVAGTELPVNPWPTILVVVGALVAIIVVTAVLNALRRRRALKHRYEQTVAETTDPADLLGPQSRTEMHRLRAMAQNPASVLPEVPGGTEDPGEVRAELAGQLKRLGGVLDRVTAEASRHREADGTDTELAFRLLTVSDTYQQLGTVLTRGIAANRSLMYEAVAGHRDRLDWLAQALELPGARQSEAGAEALTVLVTHTNRLEEIRQLIEEAARGGKNGASGAARRSGARRQRGDGVMGMLRRRQKGSGQDAAAAASVATPAVPGGPSLTPREQADAVLNDLEAMRRRAREVGRALPGTDKAAADSGPGELVAELGWEPGQRVPASDPLEVLEAAPRLTVPSPERMGRVGGWFRRRDKASGVRA